jgi:hypothetical protein
MTGEVHNLKTHPDPFRDIITGKKPFEYRWNDRNFQVEDILRLTEYDPRAKMFTGREAVARVTYILHGGVFGIPEGFCIMGIKHTWNPSIWYSREYRIWRILKACEQVIYG